ncbi:MAG: adenylate/guanylate cyclase domain-containing protein [Acidimicrobiia bacterium]|jgi:class 3 adenylate cyclase
MTEPSTVGGTRRGNEVRVVVWALHMALPLLALWLLLAQPDLDVTWQHQPSHFWLVAGVAALNVVLALRVLAAARLREDARVLLVGYAFVLAAGFLGLHALATPGVLLSAPNGGFEIATPFGLALASILFAAATIDFTAERARLIVERDRTMRWLVLGILAVWAVVSLAELPPLADPLSERAAGGMRWVAVVAVALYLVAALGFFLSHRRRPSVMLVALTTASILLAEAMVTIMWARSWQLSWWLWHLLMAAAFGFVAYSAYSQYQREGGSAGIFDGIVSQATAEEIRDQYGGALETLTDALQKSLGAGLSEQEIELVVQGLRARFALTEGQTEVLARAARSLAAERDQARRLGALALIGTEVDVEKSDEAMLEKMMAILAPRFAPDVVRIGMKTDDVLVYPAKLSSGLWPEGAIEHSLAIEAGAEQVGAIEFARVGGEFRDRDVAIFSTLAAEMGIALENARLYSQLDGLFRTYLSPDVADTLRSDPSLAELGGSMVELTALFADLRGFTSFSESTDPATVMEMLNRYFGRAVPVILDHGGTVVQFVGDALLAVFDAPSPRPDHAFRAARAALEMQAAIDEEAGQDPRAPRFRIGINTGFALIGNVGSAQMRSFNVVGDAVNVASRLETAGEPGKVLISETTYHAIADRVVATSLGRLELKGKSQPIVAYLLEGLADREAADAPHHH